MAVHTKRIVTDYYSKNLAGRRLERCYEVASPRVKQYLKAEILHVLDRLSPSDHVLELGCGYGRVAFRLAEVAHRVVGIDNAAESIEYAKGLSPPDSVCEFMMMDALDLQFDDHEFSLVVCVQNGVCAFGVDQERLLREALRVTRPGGRVLFSTYSDSFWEHRLDWFRAQASAGMMGRVDESASGNGAVVCEDGFRSGRLLPRDFEQLCARVGVESSIAEVDESSVFCEIVVS